MGKTELKQLLESLDPRNDEERSLLGAVLVWAEQWNRGEFLARRDKDGAAFLSELAPEAQRLFHGLVEALGIYLSVHGRIGDLQSGALGELKQIRDLCLQEGLSSIY